ncbi:MAG: hypothetical protein JSU70_18345 [Phycisphaerales bacterium]|nr:MAG: hypothetical protein JSU70_18345 [Phycisphaerales bacterium]
MEAERRLSRSSWRNLATQLGVACLLTVGGPSCTTYVLDRPAGQPPKIFDGSRKVVVVNGYSTSFRWPALLQKKLGRF